MNRPETTTETVVLTRAREEVARMHLTLAVLDTVPPHVPRAWCEDCETVVVLIETGACPCGSRSVVPHGARRAA